MNLPNKITLSRIILIPIIIFFYLSQPFFYFGKIFALALFLIAMLTDFLDGYIARKYNLVTTLGKFLDSIADKMLVLAVLVLLVADGTILAPYGVIAYVIIVFRELVVSALRQLAASKNVIIAADMWGKVKANFQFFATALFMLYGFLLDIAVLSSTFSLIMFILCYTLLGLTVLSTIISGIHYVIKNKQVFSN